jgi:hypothetical protein
MVGGGVPAIAVLAVLVGIGCMNPDDRELIEHEPDQDASVTEEPGIEPPDPSAPATVRCVVEDVDNPGAQDTVWCLHHAAGSAGPQPMGRYGHGLAYDSARKRGVMYAGWQKSRSSPGRAIWEWDGAAWQQIRPANKGPVTWMYFGMTYDEARGLTVTHGGYINELTDACGYSEKRSRATWGWDGAEWELLSCDGPPTRGSALAYDSRRERIVMIGGYSGERATWEWDGKTWTQITTDGPSGRDGSLLAYDVIRERTVLFGGETLSLHDDTWEWDGETWELVADSGPPGAVGGAMTYSEERERVVLFIERQTWEWDGVAWERIDVPGPSWRTRAAVTYDRDGERVVMFGGDANPSSDVLLPETWTYASY